MMKSNKITAIASTAIASLLMLSCGCAAPTPPKDETKHDPVSPIYSIPELVPTLAANDASFAASAVQQREDSPLKGKTIYWLGSSVTYGSASEGESMADYLAALTGCICKKDAVSGTTIFNDGKTQDTGVKSYTYRLTNSTVFDKTEKVDAFICQISTNDARNNRLDKRGELTDEDMITSDLFDLTTTIGGIEYIITYVTETWGCPVYFYSGAWFGNSGTRSSTNPTGTNYGKLIEDTRRVVEKYAQYAYDFSVGVIDLFNDEDFNAAANDDYYKWSRSDAIHPKKAGYLQWWTPYFESYLINHLVYGYVDYEVIT